MILILIAFAAMGVTDIVLDSPDSWMSAHVFLELGLVSLSLGAAIYLASAVYLSQALAGHTTFEPITTIEKGRLVAFSGKDELRISYR